MGHEGGAYDQHEHGKGTWTWVTYTIKYHKILSDRQNYGQEKNTKS
jgi:hypothetical protein